MVQKISAKLIGVCLVILSGALSPQEATAQTTDTMIQACAAEIRAFCTSPRMYDANDPKFCPNGIRYRLEDSGNTTKLLREYFNEYNYPGSDVLACLDRQSGKGGVNFTVDQISEAGQCSVFVTNQTGRNLQCTTPNMASWGIIGPGRRFLYGSPDGGTGHCPTVNVQCKPQ